MIFIDLWRRQWHPTPVLLPGKSYGRRSLVGCSPWGRWELDTTEPLHFHFSLSCIGEGNGNPLQYSCLENPRDGGAWQAAVYGVAQNRTRLKQLSSRGFPGSARGEESTCQCRRHKSWAFDPWVRKNTLEKEMAAHSSVLAWEISQAEEPGRLQSMGSQRGGHN